MEGILEYINALEDAQKQSKRSDNLITADTLLLTMSNTILLSELPPQYGEIWEDLNKYEKNWAAWKNLYKAADWKAKVKKGSCRPGPIRRCTWCTKVGSPGPTIERPN